MDTSIRVDGCGCFVKFSKTLVLPYPEAPMIKIP